MSRYSLNLRSKYRPDEPTTGGGIAAGIQTALDEVQKYREADREEQNAMAAAGARRTKAPPTVGERVRGIGRAIGGLLGRDEDRDPNDADDRVPLRSTGTFAPVTPQVTPPGVGPGIVPALTPAVRLPATTPLDDASAVARGVAGANAGPVGTPAPPMPATNAVAATRPSIANALQSEIEPYTYKGVHGAEYSVDPLYGARVKAAGGEFDEQRKIQSLIDAGMDPKEARARVLNNVVKYDDTFGQQSRAGTRISNEEWDRRQAKLQADREALERLKQSGHITSQDYARRRLELQEQEAADRRLRGDVQTETTIAGAIDRTIPKDPIARSTETEAEKADRERRERDRDKHINSAVDAAARQRNAHATRDQAAARAKALKNQGLSDDEIRSRMKSEGYNIQ